MPNENYMQQYYDKYFEEINYKGATGVSADSAEKITIAKNYGQSFEL